MSEKPLRVIAGEPDRPLVIGEIKIECYVLEDETRVLSRGGFQEALGRHRTSKRHQALDVVKLPAFLAAGNINRFISNELETASTPIKFKAPARGPIAYGYRAELLPQVCEVYLQARDAEALLPSQQHIAVKAELLIRGFAQVGIIALVDEATGYNKITERRALARILEKYLERELHPWTKTFPYSFYDEICKLKRWPSWYAVKRPHKIAEYTNDFIYARIAPGILKELRKRNPIDPETGERKVKHHQWFTEKIGHPKLKEHIAIVTALLKASPNWSRFKGNLQRVFPQKYDNFLLAFMDDD